MAEPEDTQPIDQNQLHLALGWDVNRDGEIQGVEEVVPEPALARAILFAIANIVALVVGHEVFDAELMDKLIAAYSLIGPVILGLWIRRHVSPATK